MQSVTTDTQAGHCEVPAQGKTWRKPQPTVLPIEDTATNATTGNDGNGPTTAS